MLRKVGPMAIIVVRCTVPDGFLLDDGGVGEEAVPVFGGVLVGHGTGRTDMGRMGIVCRTDWHGTAAP